MSDLRLSVADSSQNHVANNHENKRNQKNDPPRELVEKPLRSLRPEVVSKKTSPHNARGIADDRQGDHQDGERIAHPAPTVGKVADLTPLQASTTSKE
jgi:hypothetical protein